MCIYIYIYIYGLIGLEMIETMQGHDILRETKSGSVEVSTLTLPSPTPKRDDSAAKENSLEKNRTMTFCTTAEYKFEAWLGERFKR